MLADFVPPQYQGNLKSTIAKQVGFKNALELTQWCQEAAKAFWGTTEYQVLKNSVQGEFREVAIPWAKTIEAALYETRNRQAALNVAAKYQREVQQTNKAVEFGYSIRTYIVQDAWQRIFAHITPPCRKPWHINEFIALGLFWAQFLLRGGENVAQWRSSHDHNLDILGTADYTGITEFETLRLHIEAMFCCPDIDAAKFLWWENENKAFLAEFPNFLTIFFDNSPAAASCMRKTRHQNITQRTLRSVFYLIGLIDRDAQAIYTPGTFIDF